MYTSIHSEMKSEITQDLEIGFFWFILNNKKVMHESPNGPLRLRLLGTYQWVGVTQPDALASSGHLYIWHIYKGFMCLIHWELVIIIL